jgi:hypothetical protein
MPAKTSKEVTDRQKTCQFLHTALVHQGIRISDRLLERIRPHLLEGDAEPSFQGVNIGLARQLEGSVANLVALDETLYEANARIGELRAQRNATTEELIQQIVHLRQTLQGQYVAPNLERLGFGPRTNRLPMPLIRQANRLVATFQGPEIDELLGEPFYSQTVAAQELVAGLGPLAERLQGLLLQVDQAQRELDETLVEKQRQLKLHDNLFVHSARNFEALCRIAGEQELANRVRPNSRRNGRPEDGPEDEPELPPPVVTGPAEPVPGSGGGVPGSP